jgi:hypothetical protein
MSMKIKLCDSLCSLCEHCHRAGLFSDQNFGNIMIEAKEWCDLIPNTFPKVCKSLQIIRYNEVSLFTNSVDD